MRLARLVLGITLFAAIGCGGKDSSGPPGGAASIVAGSGAAPTATVGTAVASSPTFTVRNSGGSVLAGIPVSVTVSSGGGSLSGAPTVSGAGET